MSLIDTIRRVRRSPGTFHPDGDTGPPVALAGKKVLLVYLFPALGDVILLGPVVKALLDGGAAKVGVALKKKPARLFTLLDLDVTVHAIGEGAERVAQQIARAHYDVAVDLTFRTGEDGRAWLERSGAEVTLGWIGEREDRSRTGLSHGTPDVRYQAERHWSRYQMLPLRCLGVDKPSFDLGFALDKKAHKAAAALYGERPRVLLVPGARNEHKRWPSDRFVDVGRWVVDEAQGSVVVTGAPSEAPLLRAIAKPLGKNARVYAKKDLATLVALVEGADVVISNDTGPMHLAFLLGRSTIALFTWMSPVCWGPPSADPRFVVLNVPEAQAGEDRTGALARAVIHYLDGMIQKAKIR